MHPRIAVLYSKDKSSISSVLNMTHECNNLMHSNGTGSTKLDLGVGNLDTQFDPDTLKLSSMNDITGQTHGCQCY